MRRVILASMLASLLLGLRAYAQGRDVTLELPMKPKSVRFAVIGDSGTGQRAQFEVAALMSKYHASFPFDFVLMLGDNIYGAQTAEGFRRKFEDPYKPLLDAGVKFYASLGNHDSPNERFYKPFNMDGRRYYGFRSGDAQFYALDSNYMDPEQMNWLQDQLESSRAPWKLCFFHHPLYSYSKFHGADRDLRTRLEPIFETYGVNVALSGHDHIYERIKPQQGIYYFVLGSAGQLRFHDIHPSDEIAKGFDSDRAFMLVEIAGDELYFQTIARSGETVDRGVLERQKKSASMNLPLPGMTSHRLTARTFLESSPR